MKWWQWSGLVLFADGRSSSAWVGYVKAGKPSAASAMAGRDLMDAARADARKRGIRSRIMEHRVQVWETDIPVDQRPPSLASDSGVMV